MSRLERLYSPPEIGAPGKREARGRRRDLLLAGLFVLAMGMVAIGVLALVVPGLFGGAYRLRSYFADANGLDRGIQVLQDGFTIGMVESVTPIFPGRDQDADECPTLPGGRAPDRPCFRATLRIIGDWPVPIDSSAQLGSAGLLQGEVIKVTPGLAATALDPGAVLAARGREVDLMAQLGALTDTLQSLVDETIAPALASIQAQIKTIGDLLGVEDNSAAGAAGSDGAAGGAGAVADGALGSANRERLAGAFENLRKVSADIERIVDPEQIGAILGSVEKLAANLAQVSGSLNERSGDVREAVQGYRDLAGDIRRVVNANEPGIRSSIDDAQYLLQELAASLAPILANIETASLNLSALARELRAHPTMPLRGREQEGQAPWFQR